MIEVSNESWHARIYLWWYFAKWPSKKQYGDKIVGNLCPYVRTVLLWGPFRWLFAQGRVGGVRVAFVAWPLLLASLPQPLGYLSYRVKHIFWAIDSLLLALLVFVFACYGATLVLAWLDETFGWTEKWNKRQQARKAIRMKRDIEEWDLRRVTPKAPKGPSFWNLIGQRISATHDRICPEIVFKKFTD